VVVIFGLGDNSLDHYFGNYSPARKKYPPLENLASSTLVAP